MKALARLGEIDVGEGRWREAFLASQRATRASAVSSSRTAHGRSMGRRFENLFLDDEADKLPRSRPLRSIRSFGTLIPPGRRGDEIARRLADRLHDLDLGRQASGDPRAPGCASASTAWPAPRSHRVSR